MSTGGDVDIEIDDVCDFGDVDCGEMEALVRVQSNNKSSISPNFDRQAKIRRCTLFSKKFHFLGTKLSAFCQTLLPRQIKFKKAKFGHKQFQKRPNPEK